MTARCPECGGLRGMPRMLDMTSDNPHECAHEFHKSEAPLEVEETPNVAQGDIQNAPGPNIPGQAMPLCPYCGAEGRINGRMTNMGPFKIMTVFCRDCHKILFGFQALELQMMPIPPGQPN